MGQVKELKGAAGLTESVIGEEIIFLYPCRFLWLVAELK